jgi:hypothetical protein
MNTENDNEALESNEGAEAVVEETPEFDSNAFIENGEATTPTVENNDGSEEPGDSGDSDDGDFGWDNTEPSANDPESNEEPTGDTGGDNDGDAPSSDGGDTEDPPKPDTPSAEGTIDYSAMGEEYGFEGVETKEDLDKSISELRDNLKVYKELADDSLTNDTIKKLSSYQKLNNEDLVRRDLELQGITGDKLEDAIDVLSGNGTLSIEADKIRHNVNRAISSEQEKIVASRKDQDAKQLQDHEDSIKELKAHLDKTETMFGLNMSKDPEKLQDVRDKHHEYITSGSFLKDVTASNESISEAAWLWKHRDTLIKALTNRGNQSGKKDVLDNLGNHDPSGNKRILAPEGNGEFNASKFNT